MSLPTTPSQTPPPETLTRQLRLFKWLAALLAAALVIGGGVFFFLRHLGQPVTIFVNDKPVATVCNAATANTLIAAAEQSKVGMAYAGQEPVRMQKVRLVRADAAAPQDPNSIATAKIAEHLTLHIHAYLILVKGRPSIALPTSEDATQTLQLVKDHWANAPPQAEIVDEKIVEPVEFPKRAVDTRLTRQTPEQAAPYFWTPPPTKTYLVRNGDLGSRVAYRNHISLADLITANPNKDMDRLKPGEVLNVQKMPLLLTVRVRKKLTATEKVYPSAPVSEAGRQIVTYLVTYLNGHEAHREAQSVEILEKPAPRMSL